MTLFKIFLADLRFAIMSNDVGDLAAPLLQKLDFMKKGKEYKAIEEGGELDIGAEVNIYFKVIYFVGI